MPIRHNTDLAKQLWAVGDPVRLRILRLLSPTADCEHGYNVSALGKRLELSQPTISHHLRILRQAGLVSNRKMCRDVFYWIDPAGAAVMTEALKEVFTGNTPPKRRKKIKGAPFPGRP